ncbi:MAG: Lactococcus phage [Bacteroidota bacterium]|jgi:hypothetical protein
MSKYLDLRKLDVSSHIEKKNGLSYLSWSWAWDIFKQNYPQATYEIIKNPNNGLPYFESHAGAMVYTKVTADDITHEMWLPVMDGANKAMKHEAYTYKTRNGDKLCEAFSMTDVNKAIMRCLVKNLAMFGLAIYIYSGEDLPSDAIDVIDTYPYRNQILEATSLDDLQIKWKMAYKAFANNPAKQLELEKEKDKRKTELLAIKPNAPEEQEQA